MEAGWDSDWAPPGRFPPKLCYGALRRTGSVCATYYFDLASFRENEISRSVRDFSRK